MASFTMRARTKRHRCRSRSGARRCTKPRRRGFRRACLGLAKRCGLDRNSWFGEGRWGPEAQETNPRGVAAKPKNDEDEGPPKLRRPEPDTSAESSENPSAPPATAPAPQTTAPTPSPDEKKTPGGTSPAPPASAPSTAPSDDKPPEEPVSTSANDEDPNRPGLK